MIEAGVPKEKGAIEFTLMEHVEGRGYIKGMSEAFDKLKSGDRQASAKIVDNAKNILRFSLSISIRKTLYSSL